jgi:hypothetical protein
MNFIISSNYQVLEDAPGEDEATERACPVLHTWSHVWSGGCDKEKELLISKTLPLSGCQEDL